MDKHELEQAISKHRKANTVKPGGLTVIQRLGNKWHKKTFM